MYILYVHPICTYYIQVYYNVHGMYFRIHIHLLTCLNSNQILEMGNSALKEPKDSLNLEQEAYRALELIFKDSEGEGNLRQLTNAIVILSKEAFEKPFTATRVSPIWLKIVGHPNFMPVMMRLLQLLLKRLTTILKKKLQIIVSREQYRSCLTLINFILYYTNEVALQATNGFAGRTDIDPQIKKDIPKESIDQKIFNEGRPSKQHSQQMAYDFLTILDKLIKLRMKVFTRSQVTFQIISRLQQSLFILYCKLMLSPFHPQVLKRARSLYTKTNTIIGVYFLALGANYKNTIIFDMSVLFCTALFKDNPAAFPNDLKALPSHLFKHLPVFTHNKMFHYLPCTLLFSLTFIKKNEHFYHRFLFNRINCLKLLTMVVASGRVANAQLQYALEELIVQVKKGQIERAYIVKIAEEYSTYSEEKSKIIAEFIVNGKESFNVSYSKKQFQIENDYLISVLEDHATEVDLEIKVLVNRYAVEILLHRSMVMCYDEAAIWSDLMEKVFNRSGLEGEGGPVNKIVFSSKEILQH